MTTTENTTKSKIEMSETKTEKRTMEEVKLDELVAIDTVLDEVRAAQRRLANAERELQGVKTMVALDMKASAYSVASVAFELEAASDKCRLAVRATEREPEAGPCIRSLEQERSSK